MGDRHLRTGRGAHGGCAVLDPSGTVRPPLGVVRVRRRLRLRTRRAAGARAVLDVAILPGAYRRRLICWVRRVARTRLDLVGSPDRFAEPLRRWRPGDTRPGTARTHQ